MAMTIIEQRAAEAQIRTAIETARVADALERIADALERIDWRIDPNAAAIPPEKTTEETHE